MRKLIGKLFFAVTFQLGDWSSRLMHSKHQVVCIVFWNCYQRLMGWSMKIDEQFGLGEWKQTNPLD